MTLGPDFDRTLASARAGAERAWAALYGDLAPVVLGYLRTRGCRDPEDVLGDVFVNVVRHVGGFEGGERDFRAWVFTIAHRRLIDQYRRRARHEIQAVEEEALEETGPIGDAESEAVERLEAAHIRKLIGRLTRDQQDVLLLRLAGLSLEEVARAVGKGVGAVKALQRRAIARLRREISKEGVSR